MILRRNASNRFPVPPICRGVTLLASIEKKIERVKRRTLGSTLVLLILVSAATLAYAPFNAHATGPSKRFGFAFININNLINHGYSAAQFFNGMFLTPPYPSTVQLLENNGIDDIVRQSGTDFLLSLMQQAASYPNIKLGLDVAFDTTSSAQWSQFKSTLAQWRASPYWASLAYIGFSMEQLDSIVKNGNSTWQINAFDKMKTLITNYGWQFISYYPQGWKEGDAAAANYLWMNHTNFPEGDPQNRLADGVGRANFVGSTIGVDALQMFPSPGCTSVYGNSFPAWSTKTFPEGYLGLGYNDPTACANAVTHNGYPPTIKLALSTIATHPDANRQYVNLVAGNNASVMTPGGCCAFTTFTGVSGVTTYFLWDNPAFRAEMTNWITANPDQYITGENAAGASTTTAGPTITITVSTTLTVTASLTTTTTTTQTATASASGPQLFTIRAVDQYGTTLPGFYVVLYNNFNGTEATGFTPMTWSLPSGVYMIQVDSYGTCIVNHWKDGGSSLPGSSLLRAFATSDIPLILTAVLNC